MDCLSMRIRTVEDIRSLAQQYHTAAFFIQDGLGDLLHERTLNCSLITIDLQHIYDAAYLLEQAHTLSHTGSSDFRSLVITVYQSMDRLFYQKDIVKIRERIEKDINLTQQLPDILGEQKIPFELINDFKELDRFYFYLYCITTRRG